MNAPSSSPDLDPQRLAIWKAVAACSPAHLEAALAMGPPDLAPRNGQSPLGGLFFGIAHATKTAIAPRASGWLACLKLLMPHGSDVGAWLNTGVAGGGSVVGHLIKDDGDPHTREQALAELGWLYQLGADLVLEDVNFQSPKLSRRLNRLIQNFGQGVLTEKLTQIERQFGITVEHRTAAYTSQECHSCGYVAPRNRASQAHFQCLFCNRCIHADVQAARVLRDRRSIASVPTRRLSRQHLLTELVSQFGVRHTRPRGGPADPRFSNPYFAEWAKAHRPKLSEADRAEVSRGRKRPLKNAA